jgi:hypothetical protein
MIPSPGAAGWPSTGNCVTLVLSNLVGMFASLDCSTSTRADNSNYPEQAPMPPQAERP